jgi:hypothetical protein
MPKQNVRFVAVKTIKKPVRVKFKTKSGKTVSFKAVKTFEKKAPVHFRAKKR